MTPDLIQVIYASTSGNTEIVVEKVADIWREHGYMVELHRAEKTDPEIINRHSLFLLATSTWEHGQLNPFFKKIFDHLKTVNCSQKTAMFLGCGDTRYEPVLFCGGMETLRERWITQGGQEIGERLKINGEPYAILDTTVTQWAEKIQILLPKAHHE